MRDHDGAPRLLNPDSEQAGSRSCVGRDRTDGRRDLDHVAAARLGRSGHLIAAAISAAPFRPEHQRRGRRGRRLLRHASESQGRLQVAAGRAASKHFGDSRSRGKEGQPPWPITAPSRRGDGDAHVWRGARLLAIGWSRPAFAIARVSRHMAHSWLRSSDIGSESAGGGAAALLLAGCGRLGSTAPHRHHTLETTAAAVGVEQ